jgi:hypothetical protein
MSPWGNQPLVSMLHVNKHYAYQQEIKLPCRGWIFIGYHVSPLICYHAFSPHELLISTLKVSKNRSNFALTLNITPIQISAILQGNSDSQNFSSGSDSDSVLSELPVKLTPFFSFRLHVVLRWKYLARNSFGLLSWHLAHKTIQKVGNIYRLLLHFLYKWL